MPGLQNDADGGYAVPQNGQPIFSINNKVHTNLSLFVFDQWTSSSISGFYFAIRKIKSSPLDI